MNVVEVRTLEFIDFVSPHVERKVAAVLMKKLFVFVLTYFIKSFS